MMIMIIMAGAFAGQAACCRPAHRAEARDG
jgi:hypothetical protein